VGKLEPSADKRYEAYDPPIPEEPIAAIDGHPLALYRSIAMFGFGAASLFDGLVQALRTAALDRVPAALAMASACTMWCIVDSSMRREYYQHSFRWLTVWTWPLAMPVYLIRTRGARGALLALGGLVAFLVTQAMGYFAGTALRRV
jgi:hypothetical protein